MDDFLGLIDELNDLARDLLEGAQELDEDLGGANPGIEKTKERLERVCKTLTTVVRLCEEKGSLLHRLVRSIAGTAHSDPLKRVKQYLAEHRARLVGLQVPEAVIDRVIKVLSVEAESTGGVNALHEPQSLQVLNALEPLRELRDAVCAVANAAEIAEIVATPQLLKQVAAGCIGAAAVVLDITAAIAASPADPTAWVLLKAVKSVWGGGIAAYRAAKEIMGMLKKIRETASQSVAERNRRNIARHGPAPKLKSKKDQDW